MGDNRQSRISRTFVRRVKRTKKSKTIISSKIITREKNKNTEIISHWITKPHNNASVPTGVLFLTVCSDITLSVLPISTTVNIFHYFHCNLRVPKKVSTRSTSSPSSMQALKLNDALQWAKKVVYYFASIISTYEMYLCLLKRHTINTTTGAIACISN
jgi:hypothetical protein